MKYKEPDERVEQLFDKSFKAIVNHYEEELGQLHSHAISLENINFDTGKKTVSGEYEIADETYYKLLKKLDKNNFKDVNKDLKQNIITFYAEPEKNSLSRKKNKMETINTSVNSIKSNAFR